MSQDKWVIITHPDGREYSVQESAYEKRYAELGFKIDRPETPDDFIADVPPPKRPRGRPRRKVG